MKKADNNKDFLHRTILKVCKTMSKKNDLNENDPIDNNSFDSSKDKEKNTSSRNTKAKHTILKVTKLRSTLKHFSGAKIDYMKHHLKSAQKKSPDQIIFHVGAKDLVTSKDFNEIANQIVQLAKSATTDKNMVPVSRLVPRKDK